MSSDSGRAAGPIGRVAEVRRIVDALDGRALAGESGVLLVGSRGMGRTTLLNAAADDVDGARVLVRGLPGDPGSAYSSLMKGLRSAAVQPAGASLVPQLLAPVVEAAMGAGPTDDPPPPHRVTERILAAAREHVTPPVSLLVDDLHLCDEASQQVFVQLAQQGSTAGLPTVLSVDESADLTRFEALTWVRLGPLDLQSTADLVARTTGAPPPHRVGKMLHLWSGGNPLLLIDLVRELSAAELRGTAPIALPLTPSAGLVERVGGPLRALTERGRQLLAVFAVAESLPADALEQLARSLGPSTTVTPGPPALEDLLAQHWLTARQCSVAPSRRLDALVAWAALSPSAQQQLAGLLSDLLGQTRPPLAAYLGALAARPAAHDRLTAQLPALFRSGEAPLAAAGCALAMRRPGPTPVEQAVVLVQVLVAEGYSDAARTALARLTWQNDAPRATLLNPITQLAAVSSDPADAFAHVDAAHPPEVELDAWVTAVLTLCRVELALDGPGESSRLLTSVQPVLARTAEETRALARLVSVERDVYREIAGSPTALSSAVDAWLTEHPAPVDLGMISAVLDLLGLGRVSDARDLLARLGSPAQLTYATSRSAVLILRTEAEIAAGHYRRAAALLLQNEVERPSPSGADLMIVSQAIRIGAVCDDITRCRSIEERLGQQTSAILSYPSRRSHTAARGYRELVQGNYASARVLLALALEGPALLLQGRTCILTDLIESTAADGDRIGAADLLSRHLSWLPDAQGERAAGLLARCQALVAGPDLVDARFAAALAAHPGNHEADRARTLVAYGRTLVDLGRGHDARRPLTAAVELLRESRMPGWERHARDLLERTGGSRPSPTPSDHALTDFERRVLDLVLERRRNRDIAATLFVSLRTVESHLTRIFRKLGVSTKAQLFRQLKEPGQLSQDSRDPDTDSHTVTDTDERDPLREPAELTRNSAPSSPNGFRSSTHQR